VLRMSEHDDLFVVTGKACLLVSMKHSGIHAVQSDFETRRMVSITGSQLPVHKMYCLPSSASNLA
jgi:hypothetical protein